MNYRLYNNTLCLDVWDQDGDSYKLKSDVQKALMTIAEDFIEKNLTENDLSLTIKDVILIGSITNFNWTPYSDFDMHIIVDFAELDMSPEDAKVLVDGLKSSWNKEHAITIKGHPVELYIQDVKEEPSSMSSYSVKNDDWIKRPVKHTPTFDKEFIKRKHAQIKSKLDDMLANPSEESLEAMLERIYDMRQAGLDKKGEFSEENIVFKILRSQGYLDRIRDAVRKVYDAERSLDEVEKIDDGIYTSVSADGKNRTQNVIVSPDGPGTLIPVENVTKHLHTFQVGEIKVKIFAAYTVDNSAVANAKKLKWHDGKIGPTVPKLLAAIRDAVKHPADPTSQKNVEKLCERPPYIMADKLDLKTVSTIIPLGSSSPLNRQIASIFEKILPNASVINLLNKRCWKDVQLSDKWHREMGYEKMDGKERKGPRIAQSILMNKKKNSPNEVFQVHGAGSQGLRRYFSSFYEIDGGYAESTDQLITGKSVLLIDDTMEEGATIRAAVEAISPFQPKEVFAFIFLYGRPG